MTPVCHPDRKHCAKGLCHKCYHHNWNKTQRQSHTPEFKHRARVIKLKCNYGITESEYIDLYHKQNSSCAICEESVPLWGKGTHVDHCHSTGEVRGILCHHCNLMLGNAKDDTIKLQKAIKYLNEYKFR